MGRVWLVLNSLFSPVAIVLRIFRWSCPSFPMTTTRIMTSSPSRVRAARKRGFYRYNVRQAWDRDKTTNAITEFTKIHQRPYSFFRASWYSITKSTGRGVVRNPEQGMKSVRPKLKSRIAKYFKFVQIYPDLLFCRTSISWNSPGGDIAGKLVIAL